MLCKFDCYFCLQLEKKYTSLKDIAHLSPRKTIPGNFLWTYLCSILIPFQMSVLYEERFDGKVGRSSVMRKKPEQKTDWSRVIT